MKWNKINDGLPDEKVVCWVSDGDMIALAYIVQGEEGWYWCDHCLGCPLELDSYEGDDSEWQYWAKFEIPAAPEK